MRGIAVSLLIMAACFVEPAPIGTPQYTPQYAPQYAAPPAALAITSDAFRELEASATIDGDAVADVAPGAAATVAVVFASWCEHCRDQLVAIDRIRARHPGLRVLGVNYRPHEEYDHLGDSQRVRAYVAMHAPWLIVVPAGERLFSALGRPPKIPTLYIYDREGRLAAVYDRRNQVMPTAAELDALLVRIGA
jgi:thiol-disulfide isomerase/thioredoxin